jgi:hypothetical protein
VARRQVGRRLVGERSRWTPPRTRTARPSAGSPDLNLTVTEVIPHVLFAGHANLVFVEIRTSGGIIGLGEASLEGKTEAVVGAINDVAGYLIGSAISGVEKSL